MKRLLQWLKRWGILIVLLPPVGLGVGYGILRSSWGNQLLAATVVRILNTRTAGSIALDRLDSNLWSYATLHGLEVHDASGNPVVVVEKTSLSFQPLSVLTTGTLTVGKTELDGLNLNLAVDRQGGVNLLDSLSLTPDMVHWLPIGIDVNDVQVQGVGHLLLGEFPIPLETLELSGALGLNNGLTVELHGLDATTPVLSHPLGIEGGLVFDGQRLSLPSLAIGSDETRIGISGEVADLFGIGGVDLKVGLTPLSIDILPQVKEAGLDVSVQGDVSVSGDWSDLSVNVAMTEPKEISAQLGVQLTEAQWPWKLHADVIELDLQKLIDTLPRATQVTASVELGGTLPATGPVATGTLGGKDVRAVGLRFHDLGSNLTLNKGTLQLKDGSLSGDIGEVTFDGQVDLLDQHAQLSVGAEVLLDKLGTFGVPPGLAGSAKARLTATGTPLKHGLKVEGGLDLQGATYQDFVVSGGHVDFDGTLDRKFHLSLNAQPTIPKVSGHGVALEKLAAGLTATWEPYGAFEATGSGSARRGKFTDWARLPNARARFSLRAHPTRDLHVTAAATLPVLQLSGVKGPPVTARAVLNGDVLGVKAVVKVPGMEPVNAALSVDLADRVLRVEELLATPPKGPVWQLASPGTAILGKEGLQDLQVRLTSERGSASIDGDVLNSGLNVTVETSALELALVRDWLPQLAIPEVEGTVQANVTVSGKESLKGEVRFQGSDLGLKSGPHGLAVEGDIQLRDSGAGVRMTVAREAQPVATVHGTVPIDIGPHQISLPEEEMNLVVDVPEHSLESLMYLMPDDRLVERLREYLDGQASAHLVISGPPRAPVLTGTARGDLRGLSKTFTVDLALAGDRNSVTAKGAATNGEEELAQIRSTIHTGLGAALEWAFDRGPLPDFSSPDFWLPSTFAEVKLEGLPLETPLHIAGAHADVDGKLFGGFELAGQGFTLKPRGQLLLENGRMGEVAIEKAELGLKEDGSLELVSVMSVMGRGPKKKSLAQHERGDFRVTGRLPLAIQLNSKPEDWFTEPVDITLAGRGIPVAALGGLDPEVRDARGWLKLTGTVKGTPLAPDLDVETRLADGGFRYRELGIRLDPITLTAAGKGSSFKLETLHIRTKSARRQFKGLAGASTIDVSGGAHVTGDGVGLDFVANLKNTLLVSRSAQLLRVSTPEPLTLTGDLFNPYAQGSIRLDQALLTLDKVTLMEAEVWEGSPRRLDPLIEVVRSEPQIPLEKIDKRPFWAPITADLKIDLGSNLQGGLTLPYIDGLGAIASDASTIQAEGQLVGKLDVHLEDGKARVAGRADILRGQAKVVRSHFHLDGGSVTFIDNDPFQPFVSTHGTMALSGGVTIEMNLRGTPTSADVAFTSSQIDEVDRVLSAVITGQNPNLSSGNIGAATSLAAGVVMTTLFPNVDLGAFEFREGLLTMNLNLGKQLRIVPMAGLSTRHGGDSLALQLDWFPSARLLIQGFLGNYQKKVGFSWQRRF